MTRPTLAPISLSAADYAPLLDGSPAAVAMRSPTR
jgi:hypothetical protein